MPKIKKVILLIETSRGWPRGLLRGISHYSRLHGPWGFFRISEFYWFPGHKKRKAELSLLKDWGADGIITREMEDIDELMAMNIPVVGSDAEQLPPNLPVITGNYFATGRMAAEHLFDRGFKHFAYCGYSDTKWSAERMKSFIKRVEEAGHQAQVYERPMAKMRRLWKNESNVIAEWLKSLPKPVGLMACSDDRSQHVLEACKIAGLDVPTKVAIIGVDNDELICELYNPPLSSVAVNTERAGYEAAELLDKLMAGEKMAGQTIVVQPTHIVTRQSTDILAIEDGEVAEAVRFIRQHSRHSEKLIQVSDVVAATMLSRRSLEQHFRKILGRSVLDEITRVHMEQVAQMLVGTNLSVQQIALALGHSSADNMTRYFKHHMGITPSQYRKEYGLG